MYIKKQERNTRHGFALVELLVAISIIVILSVSLLFQQNKFDSSVQITNVAHEIASIIQQAQRYGASSAIGTSTDVGVSYGVHFDLDENNKGFILFRDLNNNGGYNNGELEEEYTIAGNTVISAISTSGTNRSSVTIVFVRPDPEPSTPAQIIIENEGETRTVEVSRTGQVQVINN